MLIAQRAVHTRRRHVARADRDLLVQRQQRVVHLVQDGHRNRQFIDALHREAL